MNKYLTNGDKQLFSCKVQNTGYQDAPGTQWVCKQHKKKKKTQAEMKFAVIEIKKNLQGTNNGGDEAKNQINDLEHKEGKNISSEQKEGKRIKNKTKQG